MRIRFVTAIIIAAALSQIAVGQKLALKANNSPQQAALKITPEQMVQVRAIFQDMNTYIGPPQEFLEGRPRTANFVVTYNGFTPQAQTAFQFAVDIWSTILTSSVPIRVTANWTPLSPGVLGSAGASTIFRDFPNAPQAQTWYAVALAEKLAGNTLNHPDSADINANFSSTLPNWYLGTDGNAPPGTFDFVSVVLHELCHGLGFFGSMTVSGGLGSWGFGTGFPVIYDRFTENGAGQQLIDTNIFPNNSAALAAQLTGNNLFFDGPEARMANGGNPPRIYAPNPWEQGSSYSHLDEATFPPGNPNSLMTPQIGQAEVIHNPGAITLGLYDDIGWTTTPPPPSSIKWEETFASPTLPPGWQIVDNDGSGSAWAYVTSVGGNQVLPQAGTNFFFSNFNNANGAGLIDEWIISPQVANITNGDSLHFYAGAIGGAFPDSLKVWVSTTGGNIGNFTNQIGYFQVDGPIGSWHEYRFDLSPFAGSNINVAVNYYIVDGGPNGSSSDNVWVDHFKITTPAVVGIDDPEGQPDRNLPEQYALAQNFPNPFNPVTHIRFALPRAGQVSVEVFNTLGQRVATLLNGVRAAGEHELTFDGANLPSGLYFYRMVTADFAQVRKMILMK